MENKWQRIKFMPGTGLGENGARVTGCEAHIDLSRRAAHEGMVLLKNDGDLLPFAPGTRIALFGKAQADYVKGGGGSGDVTVAYVRSLLEGMRIKQDEGKVCLYEPVSAYYEQNVAQQRAAGKEPGRTEEPPVPADLLADAARNADAAVITICRFSGEGYDRTGTPHDGDFYLSEGEEAMVRQVTDAFDKVAVVLNIGGVMDTSWFRNCGRIQAALLGWQAGMEGGLATADLLCGDVCPSGRLVDTFAGAFGDYPSSETFAQSDAYVTYDEDIYVGYRYFETIPGAAEKVCYPFGYGLSYTSFAVTDPEGCMADDETFRFVCSVKNTGNRAGRQVVQVYCQAPQGKLGKPARVLIAFAKTRELAPGESQQLTMTAPLTRLASYDDEGAVCKSAWVLEQGEYRFCLGVNVRDAEPLSFVYTAASDAVVEQLTARCTPTGLPRRLRADGSYVTYPDFDAAVKHTPLDPAIVPFGGQLPTEKEWPFPREAREGKKLPQLMDVVNGGMTLDAFLAQLTDEQKVRLCCGQPNRGVSNTWGVGNQPFWGIPAAMTADGPAGLRIHRECGVNTTAFPCATLLACTWDPEIAEQVGAAGALEVHENGIAVWLTPAINIHRTPLCGRNFEYYSEDPLMAGVMAAAMVRGIQSRGVAASLKHFACNNKETNRVESDSRLSERALREIYLKGFEICVKEAQPWTVMSSYNVINGVRSSENRDLLTGILREDWGFEGAVTTDWWNNGQQWLEINAGNDIKMPCGNPEHTLQMLAEGKLDRTALEASAKRVLALLIKLA